MTSDEVDEPIINGMKNFCCRFLEFTDKNRDAIMKKVIFCFLQFTLEKEYIYEYIPSPHDLHSMRRTN